MKERYKIKQIPERDLEKAAELHNNYVDEEPLENFKKHYESHPSLFVGCYDGDKLISLAWARYEGEELILGGICVKGDYWGQGIGSQTLGFLEKQVKKYEENSLSVGVGGDTEAFYLKNGYAPTFLLVRIKPKKLPPNYRALGFEIADIKKEPKEVKIRIPVKEMRKGLKKEVKDVFNAREVIYILKKML